MSFSFLRSFFLDRWCCSDLPSFTSQQQCRSIYNCWTHREQVCIVGSWLSISLCKNNEKLLFDGDLTRQMLICMYICPLAQKNLFSQTEMNLLLAKEICEYWGSYLEEHDLLKILKNQFKSKQDISPSALKDCLIRSKLCSSYSAETPQPLLPLATFISMQKDQDILFFKKILETYSIVSVIDFWKSELSEQLFKEVHSASCYIALLAFVSCQYEENIYAHLQFLQLQNLTHLNFISDPLGNKQVKTITSLNLPRLYQINFSNTNLTTDFTKLFKKINSKLYTISVNGTRNIITNVAVKQIISMFDCYGAHLNVSPFYQPFDHLYVCWMVKKQTKQCALLFLKHNIPTMHKYYPSDKNLIMSERTRRIVHCNLKIKDHNYNIIE